MGLGGRGVLRYTVKLTNLLPLPLVEQLVIAAEVCHLSANAFVFCFSLSTTCSQYLPPSRGFQFERIIKMINLVIV